MFHDSLCLLAPPASTADYFDGGQHDCQEVLRVVMDLLHEDLVGFVCRSSIALCWHRDFAGFGASCGSSWTRCTRTWWVSHVVTHLSFIIRPAVLGMGVWTSCGSSCDLLHEDLVICAALLVLGCTCMQGCLFRVAPAPAARYAYSKRRDCTLCECWACCTTTQRGDELLWHARACSS